MNNSERSKEFRARNDTDEFRAAEAKRKREYRAKKKKTKSVKIIMNPFWDDLKDKLMQSDLTELTIDTNIKRVKSLYYKMGPNKVSLDFLDEHKEVIQYIKTMKLALNTKIAYLSSISGILNIVGPKRLHKIYSKQSIRMRGKQDVVDDKNLKSNREIENWISWKELKTKIKSANLNPSDSAIVNIYTQRAPRRLEIASLLKLSRNTRLDPNFNHLIISKAGRYTIVMMKYKTFKTFGVQKLAVNPTLKTSLEALIKSKNLKYGDLLFGTPSNTPKKNFTQYIKNAFMKAVDISLSVDDLRHIYITEFLSTKRSIGAKKKLAVKMAHSLNTQGKYDRI